MWGVSRPGTFTMYSYDDAFGISSKYDQYFPWAAILKSRVEHSNSEIAHFLMDKGEVDMLLDADKGELKLCVVGQCEETKVPKLWWDAKKVADAYFDDDGRGWVPHFNLHEKRQQLRIAKIPVDLFGQKEDHVFE